jgi:putative transposase
MTVKSRITSRRGLAHANLSLWENIDVQALPDIKKKGFLSNKTAIDLYHGQCSIKEIENRTGLEKQTLYKLVDRCLTLHSDGKLWGYRACIPNTHISSYVNPHSDLLIVDAQEAKPGAFTALLRLYPSIRLAMEEYLKTGKRKNLKTKDRNPSAQKLHSYFLSLCQDSGVPLSRYPFNTEAKGAPAISHYFRIWKKLKKLGEKANWSPFETDGLPAPIRIYSAAEVDGHQIDYVCSINLSDEENGAEHWVQITRFWIILVVEVASRAILGYSISFGHKNYNQFDYIRAIKNSLIPWKPRPQDVEGLAYASDEGLPSGLIPACAYACADEYRIDNAKAQISQAAIGEIEGMGSIPVLGPIAAPDSRPLVEAFNRVLEEAGFHHVPGTVGSRSSSRSPKPAKDGTNVPRMTAKQLHDFVDILLARLSKRIIAVNGISALDFLRKQTTNGITLVRHLPMALRTRFECFDVTQEALVSSDGGVPTIRFCGGRYYGRTLKKAHVGQRVLIRTQSRDIRTLDASISETGEKLGELIVERRFRSAPHSIETRKEIKKLESHGILAKTSDIIIAYTKHIEEQAKKSKRNAARLQRLRDEQRSAEGPPDDSADEGTAMQQSLISEEEQRLKALRESLKNIKPYGI